MRLIITGAKGQVGLELCRRARLAGHQLLAWDVDELDITDGAAVEQALSTSKANVVINAAAYTAVDKAEQEPAQALAINRDGPTHLAAACAQLNIPLFHISTDYVFDGAKPTPYTENDPPSPLGVYGESKYAGDVAISKLLSRHLILRVSWVFGIEGQNFVKTILHLARERQELRVVADQYGCPTFAGDIADVLLQLTNRITEMDAHQTWGLYHYCGAPATTWHEFASAIIAQARNYESLAVRTVTAIATADYPTLARRPANSVLDCSQIKTCFGVESPPWSTGLKSMVDSLYAG